MRRPFLLCVVSFLLGGFAAWLYLRAALPPVVEPADEPWHDETPTGRIPVFTFDDAGSLSGTLDLAAESPPGTGREGTV